ncbi:MAG: tyrosine-type recombinase/integrase [Gammaproteobacteria bacterium]
MPEYNFNRDVLRPYLRDSRAWLKPSTAKSNAHQAGRLEALFKGYWITGSPADMRQHRLVITGQVVAQARERLKQEGVSPNSVKRYLSVACAACQYAISELNLDMPNPFHGRLISRADAKTVRPRNRLLEPQEEASLLIACTQPLRDMILLYLETGCRVNEIVRLEHAQVQREQLVIAFTPEQHKSGTFDACALTTEALAIIDRQPVVEGCRFVFHVEGRALAYDAIYKQWTRAVRRVGLQGLQMRDLRRTGLTRWREAFGVEAAQAQARHKDRQTTERVYARPSVEIAKDALREGSLKRRGS